jgi:hypothetical protein
LPALIQEAAVAAPVLELGSDGLGQQQHDHHLSSYQRRSVVVEQTICDSQWHYSWLADKDPLEVQFLSQQVS